MNGREAALAAGYSNTERVRTGVTASEAKRDPWVRAVVEKGRRSFAETCGLAHAIVKLSLLKALGIDVALPAGLKSRDLLSAEEAVRAARSPEFLKVARWLRDGRMEITGEDGGPLQVLVGRIERVIVDGAASEETHAQD
jgi:hypothetical protein